MILVFPVSLAEIDCLSCSAAGSAMKPGGKVNRDHMTV